MVKHVFTFIITFISIVLCTVKSIVTIWTQYGKKPGIGASLIYKTV